MNKYFITSKASKQLGQKRVSFIKDLGFC